VARESITINPASPIIGTHGDEVTVEASYLAARLGLSVDRLRAEMRRGIIYSVVERGMGEDAGRLRLTFRYRAHAWTVMVQPDGTLSEASWPQGWPATTGRLRKPSSRREEAQSKRSR